MTTASGHAPSLGRGVLIRAGFTKASPAELDWLRAMLDPLGDSRAARRRWSWPVVAFVLLFFAAVFAIVVLGTAASWNDLPNSMLLFPMVGSAVGVVAGWALAPASGADRTRRWALRRHGLDEAGEPSRQQGVFARMDGRTYLAMQSCLAVLVLSIASVLAVEMVGPSEVELLACGVGLGEVDFGPAAPGGVDSSPDLSATGTTEASPFTWAPEIEWRGGDGAVIAVRRAPRADLWALDVELDRPVTEPVSCRIVP